MAFYMKLGSIPAKRHIEHRRDGGFRNEGIYYEEVVTLAGFGRAYSICYHLRPPTRVRKVEPAGEIALHTVPGPALRHHHLKSAGMKPFGDPITGRVPLFANDDVSILRCNPTQPMVELFRNADADEILFMHQGQGTVQSLFGTLPFRQYDYVVIPRCTTYRVEFEGAGQPEMLIIEGAGNIDIPKRYLNADGQIRLGAPYSERDFHGPAELLTIDKEQDVTVVIKDRKRLTRYVLAQHPFDVVGWDGFVYPYTFNADDFESITGKIHQPPPIHQTFDAPGFVVCTFGPRMLDHHPDAVKVPYAHSNVQADEVLFYVRGQFGSRRGVDRASFTLHPRGIPHGPHPGTIVASRKALRTDELAVMVDTVKPLLLTRQALDLDDPQYPFSWLDE